MPDAASGRVSVSLTSRCNLDCGYCFARQDGEASRRTALAAAAYARRAFGPRVALIPFGGEPLLRWDLFRDFVLEGRRLGVERFDVFTNGLLLDDRVVDFFEEHRLNLIVSIDGVGQVHDAERRALGGGGTFAALERRLRFLRDRGFPNPTFRVTVSPGNGASLDSTYAFLAGLGFPRAHINAMPAASRRWSERDLRATRSSLLRLADAAAQRLKRGLYVPFHYNECIEGGELSTALGADVGEGGGSCLWGARVRGVDARGGVYPCCILPVMASDQKELFGRRSLEDRGEPEWPEAGGLSLARSCRVWNKLLGADALRPLPVYRHFFAGFIQAAARFQSRLDPPRAGQWRRRAMELLTRHLGPAQRLS